MLVKCTAKYLVIVKHKVKLFLFTYYSYVNYVKKVKIRFIKSQRKKSSMKSVLFITLNCLILYFLGDIYMSWRVKCLISVWLHTHDYKINNNSVNKTGKWSNHINYSCPSACWEKGEWDWTTNLFFLEQAYLK